MSQLRRNGLECRTGTVTRRLEQWAEQVEQAVQVARAGGGAGGAVPASAGQADRSSARWPTPMPIRSWWTRSSSGAKGPQLPEIIYYEPALPGIDDPKQMERWEPWVRAYMAIGEMLQGISLPDDDRAMDSRSCHPAT